MKKWVPCLLLLVHSVVNGSMRSSDKIYVAGHTGLVGSALLHELKNQGYTNLVTRTSGQLDLRDQKKVNDFFAQEKPDYVFLAAAKVGGIKANNDYPAEFMYNNLMIEANIIHAAYEYGVKKLLFLGSSCIYPRDCPQPILEEYLLTGELEKTNEGYALAKIAGLKLCEFYNRQYGTCFIACMPTNLYGPGDNFDVEKSHVIPGLIAKFHKAKIEHKSSVELWGTGNVYREFLYSQDLAQALIFLMNNYEDSLPINVGVGRDITIKELAVLIKRIVAFEGEIKFNHNGLDGTPKKLLNVDRINELGWHATTKLEDGLRETYDWYQNYYPHSSANFHFQDAYLP